MAVGNAMVRTTSASQSIQSDEWVLDDDLGKKRLLYERLGSAEYWVVDGQAAQVITFEMAEGRNGQVLASQVLPGLAMSTLEEALIRSRTEDDATITRWLLELFSSHPQGG
jgi:hypothetical protein